MSIQPELLYVQKGAKIDTGFDEVDSKVHIDYIEIPVLLKASFGAGSAKPNLFVGPAIGILMSAKVKTSVEGVDLGDLAEVDMKDELNSMDLGLVIGGGVDIGKMLLEVRYEIGLSNLNKTPEGYEGDMPKTSNGALLIMAGISF